MGFHQSARQSSAFPCESNRPEFRKIRSKKQGQKRLKRLQSFNPFPGNGVGFAGIKWFRLAPIPTSWKSIFPHPTCLLECGNGNTDGPSRTVLLAVNLRAGSIIAPRTSKYELRSASRNMHARSGLSDRQEASHSKENSTRNDFVCRCNTSAGGIPTGDHTFDVESTSGSALGVEVRFFSTKNNDIRESDAENKSNEGQARRLAAAILSAIGQPTHEKST